MWSNVERTAERLFAMSGGVVFTLLHGLQWTRFGRRDLLRQLRQCVTVGYYTLPLAAMIGTFVGMTVALNGGLVLRDYGQEPLIAQLVALSMIREMGPVITAVIITARVGAAITAELGTMAVNDEIDVLRVLGIRPERFLVMPRILASVLMTPLLTMYSVFVGLLGGALVATKYFGVSWINYKTRALDELAWDEWWRCILKSLIFGAIYSSVCVYQGMTTRGGAEGVGRSTTTAVVVSLSVMLVANFLLTRFLYG